MNGRTQSPQLEGFKDPPTRDELPTSLWPSITVTMYKDRPDLLDEYTKETKPIPLPDKYRFASEKIRAQISNLAQYKGRSSESTRKSLMNLQPSDGHSTMIDTPPEPAFDPAIPQPVVPTAFPDQQRHELFRGLALRKTMSTEEYDLYVATWNVVKSAHAEEYTTPEDDMDVHSLCMETVLEFRALQFMQRNPSQSDKYSVIYTAATKRKQMARENLSSRRKDRLGRDQKQVGQTNIAILVGGADVKELVEKRQKLALENENSIEKFLEATVVQSNEVILPVTSTQVSK